jgi:curli biogenesis system outer membrane secretion channel CsgG
MAPRPIRFGLLVAGALICAMPQRGSAQTLIPAGENTAAIKPVEVDCEGSGPSRDAAIAKALANALAQETGTDVGQATGSLSVQGNATTQSTSHETKTSGMSSLLPGSMRGKQDDKSGSEAVNAQVAANAVVSSSGGHVVRYNVLSVQADPAGGFVARVHAVLAIYRREASAGDNRKRIAIADFVSDASTGLGQALHDQLVIDLTQSRRFAVVDRAHDAAYQDEIAAMQSNDAAPGERSRVGQMLGADFVLLGKLHVVGARVAGTAARTESHTLELTGEVVSHTTASTLHTIPGSASAEFELMDVATREIKMADRATITGAGVDALAQHIADELLTTIYPPRLVKADDPQDLIINQGGEGMHTGQRFRLMAEGQELFDPYTHESLGKTERQLGVIEVTDVGPRMSTARLIDGALPPSGVASVLRAEKPAMEAQAAAPRRRPAVRRAMAVAPPPQADTGLKLPFDH